MRFRSRVLDVVDGNISTTGVLFDAPPIISVTDAAVLATKLDGVLLVAYAGKTRRDRVREATQLLEKVKAHVVGVVLTNAQREKGTYANY